MFQTNDLSDAVAVGIAYCRKKNLIPEFTWDKKLRKERARRNEKRDMRNGWQPVMQQNS